MISFEGSYDGELSRTVTCKIHGSVPMTYIVVRQDKGKYNKIIYSNGPHCPVCIVSSIVANVPRSYIDED